MLYQKLIQGINYCKPDWLVLPLSFARTEDEDTPQPTETKQSGTIVDTLS